VTFRPVAADDEAFLLEVYASTRLEELAMVPWDEGKRSAFLQLQYSAQKSHYHEHYPVSEYYIILLNKHPVGRLWFARLENEIRILDITLLPVHRKQGVGSPIIKCLMDEAKHSGKHLNIYVEGFNPSLSLFERLGFLKVDEHGYSFKMSWSPPI
ncbi:MAG: GNAT family N-acetyltransferase, partial [Blastocatellia bacterium]